MIEEFKYTGEWFLPETANRKVFGTLSFDVKSDPILELAGTLQDDYLVNSKQKFILGTTTDGKLVTLYMPFEFLRGFKNGRMYSSFSIFYVVMGSHFSEDIFRFKKIEAKFKNIDKWIDKYGFEVNNKFETNEVEIKFRKPENINFKISDSLNASLKFNYFYPIAYSNEVSIEQSATIELNSSVVLSFFEILDKLMLFQNFLTLGTHETAYPTGITITGLITATLTIDNEQLEPVGARCKVIYKPGFSYFPKSRHTFLFHYTDIEDHFESIIQKWFSLNETIAPVTDILLGTFYDKEKNLENSFLNLAQSLETFHTRLRNKKPYDQEEYNTWVEGVIETADKRYLEAAQILTNLNVQTLHQRIEDLINSLKMEIINKLIKDKEQFIKDFKRTRNYYTHYNQDLKSKALSGNELHVFTEKLKIVLIGLVMVETGFTLEEINGFYKRNSGYLLSHIIEDWHE